MSQYAALLQPLMLKNLTIPNRLMSTAHTSGASQDGKPKLRYQLYQEEKAKGGIGLTIVGGSTAVAEDTPGAAMLHLDASNDDIIPFYRETADRIHAHGSVVFAQLAHMGRRANWDNQHWLSPVSPSKIREPAHGSIPKEMEDWDFARLIKAFGRAAARVREGGMDGIELSATHCHLIDQFWSPKSNKRTDRYGGSLENRLRFTLELIAAVREAVGDDYVVGLRMSGDELVDNGLTISDTMVIAETLVAKGSLDYLSVLGGSADNLPAHALIFPGMEWQSAPYLHLASAIRAAIDVPVFHAQRLSDVATAARAIEDGHADMIGMTRAHLADPHIVAKLVEGRVDDIRPCIGANYCIDRLYSGGQAYCLHNPATGREETIPHIVPRSKVRRRAVVVGGGPAGLEAARVLAERGHSVTLFEAELQLGGQVRIAAQGWRESLLMVTGWLERQAVKLGVEMRMNRRANIADILELSPNVVVVATGGRPNKDGIEGQALCQTTWEILTGHLPIAKRVLLFDDMGNEAGLLTAEYLATRGAELEFVTADPHAGSVLERTTRPTFLRRLYAQDALITPDTRLTAVRQDGNKLLCRLVNEYTLVEEEREVDQVVIEAGTLPEDKLYHDLVGHSANGGAWDYGELIAGQPQPCDPSDPRFQLFRIGDAVSSRNIHAALYDARRLAKDL